MSELFTAQRVEMHLRNKKGMQTRIIIDAPTGFGGVDGNAEEWKYAAIELLKKSEVWHVRGPMDVPTSEEAE